ncbi:hypothetical protein ACIQFP_12085, partial [Nocardiopsis alba]
SCACSPRTRGWTFAELDLYAFVRLLPAHAGMDLRGARPVRVRAPAPRARGDGPSASRFWYLSLFCSLRTRGWVEVIEAALIGHAPKLFARMLSEGSPLFDEGLVDPDGLRAGVDRLAPGRYVEERDAKILEVLSLHMSATAFLS